MTFLDSPPYRRLTLPNNSVNSRRTPSGSPTDESAFGTFMLDAPETRSVRMPARFEHFGTNTSDSQVVNIPTPDWKASAHMGVKL